jgi:hypothetical protein
MAEAPAPAATLPALPALDDTGLQRDTRGVCEEARLYPKPAAHAGGGR